MPTPVPMFRPSWSVIAAREQSIASEARPQTAESASPMLSREVLVIPKPRIDRATAVLYKLASFASDSLGQDSSRDPDLDRVSPDNWDTPFKVTVKPERPLIRLSSRRRLPLSSNFGIGKRATR